MHIAVEATRLRKEKRGIGRYVRNLLREMPLVSPAVRYTLYVRGVEDIAPLREQMQSVGDVAANSTIALVRDLPRTKADVAWYAWNQVTVATHTAAMAVTIHDLVPHLPNHFRWWRFLKRWKYERRSRRSVRLAHSILADSEFTADEIVRVLQVPRTGIRVVLLAADDFLQETRHEQVDTAHLRPPGAFFLAVGARDARKNLDVLFDAMAALHARGEKASLVLCGPGKGTSRLGKADDAPWLHLAGYVSDAELAALYTQATALVFPSRYEGFGLPALEAMAAGGCVVCADASSLPEVVGDTALLFAPDDREGLCDQLVRLLHDHALRETLITRGHERAMGFTWRETARQTLEGFSAAVAARAGQRR